MLTITYDPVEGRAIPDGKVEDEFWMIMRLKDTGMPLMTTYSTENIFTYIRLQIDLGVLNCNEVQFSYNGEVFKANEYGAIPKWPDGFCDYNIGLCEQIMTTTMKKYKRKEEEAKMK